MSAFADLFLDFAYETIAVQRGTLDNEGTFTPTGSVVRYPCRFEGQVRVLRTASGQEVTSSLQAIVLATPNLHPTTCRFTLPSRYTPNASVIALAVTHETDEGESCYEEVYFP